MLITQTPKFKQMMALFNQTEQIGYRHTYAWNASNGRTESTKDLTEAEVLDIIEKLQNLDPTLKVFTPKPGDDKRKSIIAIARDMRWDIQGKRAMMDKIDEFLLTRTKYKKKLNDLTVPELNKVIYILRAEVKPSFYQGLNK